MPIFESEDWQLNHEMEYSVFQQSEDLILWLTVKMNFCEHSGQAYQQYLLSGGDVGPGGAPGCHLARSSSLIRLPCDLDLISSGGPVTNGGLPPKGSPPSK